MSCSEKAVKENSSLRGHHQCNTSMIITHKAPAAPCLCHLTHGKNNLFSLCSVFWGAYLLAHCVYYHWLQYFLKWFVSHLNPFWVSTGALLCQPWKNGKETLDSLGAVNKWENFFPTLLVGTWCTAQGALTLLSEDPAQHCCCDHASGQALAQAGIWVWVQAT